MKIVRFLGGVILGAAVFIAVLCLCSWIIMLLGHVPILGSLLFYPSDAGWAMITIPSTSAVVAGVYSSAIISGSSKCALTVKIVIAALWAMAIAGMFMAHNFSWSSFFQYAIGFATAVIIPSKI